jgi:sigma-E factor negative regulatory protein RseC
VHNRKTVFQEFVMLQETGTVVELPASEVAVVLCARSAFCLYGGPLGLRRVEDRRHMRIEAKNTVGAAVGDRVTLVSRPGRVLLSLFLLYGLPLVGLVVGALTGVLLGSYFGLGVEPDLLAALLGVGLMAGFFFLVRVGRRAVSMDPFRPQVTEILPGEEILEEEYHYGD